jgi:hypothetical protein
MGAPAWDRRYSSIDMSRKAYLADQVSGFAPVCLLSKEIYTMTELTRDNSFVEEQLGSIGLRGLVV